MVSHRSLPVVSVQVTRPDPKPEPSVFDPEQIFAATPF